MNNEIDKACFEWLKETLKDVRRGELSWDELSYAEMNLYRAIFKHLTVEQKKSIGLL